MGRCVMTRLWFERQADVLVVLHVTKAMGLEHHFEWVWQRGGVQEGLNPLGAGDVRHVMGLWIMTRLWFERQVGILDVLHVTKVW